MPHKYSLLSFFFVISFSWCTAQSKQDKPIIKQIDELITARLGRIAPGCVIQITRKGQVFYHKAFGMANLELQVPASPDMVFRIGSITKQFTAVAILQLMEQQKLALTDPVQRFIPDFPDKGHTLTIEHLLTQTSGIPDYLNLEFNLPNPFRIDIPAKQIVDSIKIQALGFVPGSKFEYSNSNYFLLGYIIERISGMSYPDYLKEHLLDPIGLTHTYYDAPATLIPNRASGYEKADTSYRNADFISMAAFYSSGALLSTTADLLAWNNALYNGSVLSKTTLAKAQQPYRLADGTFSEYGYGWFIRKIEGSPSIEHGGSIFGFRAQEIYLPNEQLYITGLFNCRQGNTDEQQLCYDLVRLMLGKPLLKEYPVPADLLARYAGTYKNDQYKQSMTIQLAGDGRLYCTLSNGTGTNMYMLAQSETTFLLPEVKRIHTTLQFVMENGKCTKVVWGQENSGAFIRVE
ncbi:MAG: serine hydrolase [Bacteroidetes bacterium]|nr:serine hydrolase [Bacteroidota bacterium]